MLMGLPVDGNPVIDPTHLDWAELCFMHLGVRPTKDDLDGSKIKLSWLANHFADVADHEHDNEQLRRSIFSKFNNLIFNLI